MFSAASPQQEMGVTLVVWVSFLVVWIIMAARTRSNSVPPSESPKEQEKKHPTATFSANAGPPAVADKPAPTPTARVTAPTDTNLSKSRPESPAQTLTQGPYEFYEWL